MSAVTVSTIVPTSPDTAFALFTQDVDLWWRRAPRHRPASTSSIVRFEDDRLVEVTDDGSTELGHVLAWEPGVRLILAWHGPQWAAAEKTEVEITFQPDGDNTRVTIEHRGWADVRTGGTEASIIGLWWGDLLAGFRYRADNAMSRSH